MTRAAKPRRRLPAALKLVLAVIMVAAIAYPFRLPPMSRARSLTFYETDGSDTACMLKELPDEMHCEVRGENSLLKVDAPVDAPKLDKVPVLRVQQGEIDIDKLAKGMGLQGDSPEVAEETTASFSRMRYTVEASVLWFDNATLDFLSNGRTVMLDIYDPGRMYAVEEVLAMMHDGGLFMDKARAVVFDGGKTIIVSPIYEGLPVSFPPVTDQYMGVGIDGRGFIVEQSEDGSFLSIRGEVMGDCEIVWDSTRVIPPEDALNALAEVYKGEETVNRIVLAYHSRDIIGDPYHILLYPVWEIYTNVSGGMYPNIVDAVTGNVGIVITDGTEEVAA